MAHHQPDISLRQYRSVRAMFMCSTCGVRPRSTALAGDLFEKAVEKPTGSLGATHAWSDYLRS